ncbi:hypothetical protein G9A89_007441 [Geosiphon pyriformis]|nr:hypothetical protein G9A89_007441 [Geosiphon pyriformis]
MVVHQLIPSLSNHLSGSHQQSLGAEYTQNPNSQNYLSLLVIPEDTLSSNQEINYTPIPINNIPSVIITENKSLNAIFSFKLEELSAMLLFSKAALEEKPITVIYTNAKVDGYFIKLILDSGLADSIITKQLIDQLGH